MNRTRYRAALVAAIVVLGFGLYLPSLLRPRRSSSQVWLEALRSIASAQEDFKAADRDENGAQDYWRGDIRGLYATPGKDGQPLRLIEISTSEAETTPKAGYLFRAIRFADEKTGALDPNRFAVCAYPASLAAGKKMALISHEGVLFLKNAAPGGVEIYPAEPVKEGWRRLD